MFVVNNLSTVGGVAPAPSPRLLCKASRFSTGFKDPQKPSPAGGEADKGGLSTFKHSLLLLLIRIINIGEGRRMFTVKKTWDFDI